MFRIVETLRQHIHTGSSFSCEKVDQLHTKSSLLIEEVDHLKALIDSKLKHYIESIENHQRPQFRFFKARQTENRQINYELAQELRKQLTTKSVTSAFANVLQLRDQIRQKRPMAPWFNSIGSRELNDIIRLSHFGYY